MYILKGPIQMKINESKEKERNILCRYRYNVYLKK